MSLMCTPKDGNFRHIPTIQIWNPHEIPRIIFILIQGLCVLSQTGLALPSI